MRILILFCGLWLAASPCAWALEIIEPPGEGTTTDLQQVQVLLPNPLRKGARLLVVVDGRTLPAQQVGPSARDGASSWVAPVHARLKPGPHSLRVSAQTVSGAEASRFRFYVPGPRPEGSPCRSDLQCATLFCEQVLQEPPTAENAASYRFIAPQVRCVAPRPAGEPCRDSAGCASHHCQLRGKPIGFCAPDSSEGAYCTNDSGCAWEEMCRGGRCLPRGATPHEPVSSHAPDAAEINQHMLDHSMLTH